MIEVKIGDINLIVTNTVLDIFMNFRQLNKKDSERGGIILGQVNNSNNRILICRATIPSNSDYGQKTSFHRNRVMAQYMVEYEFHNSDRKNTYLGEWHTHPAKNASPSQQDLNMIRQQFEQNDMKVKFILMFIVAHQELYAGMYNESGLRSVTIPINFTKY